MDKNSLSKTLLYGLSVFIVYLLLVSILRLITNKIPEETILFNFYTLNDFFFGLILAGILSVRRLKRNKN